ncbi:putative mariner transposase [Trichonephila clavipes]|nr:putative mariner transposase [Trichonephila clavipes]
MCHQYEFEVTESSELSVVICLVKQGFLVSSEMNESSIKFCFRLGHNPTKTFAKLPQAYGDSVLSKGQTLYSPDLKPCDFFLFPKLRNYLKVHQFGTLENIQTAVTDQLEANPISELHQCYEEWKKRLQRCVNRFVPPSPHMILVEKEHYALQAWQKAS